jgi:riboflavin biosynthesis pyrimidine reductase
MQELWPNQSTDVDISARLAADSRPNPPGRPWVTLVMITSVDGAIAIDGVSGGLGAPSDHQRFVAARRQADAIIVGASTVRIEDYQPATVPIIVISGSLSPDPKARLFSDPDNQPILFTTDQAARTRGTDFDGIAEVISLGDSVDPARVLADLDNRGMRTVVLEGGPTLNSHFLHADLVDEMLISYSPLIAGGTGSRLTNGDPMPDERRFTVDRVLLADDLLFARYLRVR